MPTGDSWTRCFREVEWGEKLRARTKMSDGMEVTLIGGEAYLRPDWLQFVSAIRAHGMECGMTSGGRGFRASARRPRRQWDWA